MTYPHVEIWTDGSYQHNNRLAGAGIVIVFYLSETATYVQRLAKEVSVPDQNASNSEVMAAALGLESLPESFHNLEIKLFTDNLGVVVRGNKYKVEGYSESKKVWKFLRFQVSKFSNLSFHWVKSHSGIPHQEDSDILARLGCRGKILNEIELCKKLSMSKIPYYSPTKSEDSTSTSKLIALAAVESGAHEYCEASTPLPTPQAAARTALDRRECLHTSERHLPANPRNSPVESPYPRSFGTSSPSQEARRFQKSSGFYGWSAPLLILTFLVVLTCIVWTAGEIAQDLRTSNLIEMGEKE